MKRHLALITLLVADYDEAIEFFTTRLGFQLVEDTLLEASKRWVVVQAVGSEGTAILLAKAEGSEQEKAIGKQSGGRVFLFLHTDDFRSDYEKMTKAGVHFKEKPRTEVYGTVAVFEDLYGNLWDLIEPSH